MFKKGVSDMRVLVIPSWYPSGEDKLMGIYHKEFTRALNKYGIEADLLFIERERLSKPLKFLCMKKRDTIEEDNYKVYIERMLNLSPINYDLQIKMYTRKLDRAFRHYLKRNSKPDIIHAQVTIPAGYASVKLGEKYGIQVVVTEHKGDFEKFFTKDPYRKYGKYVLEHSHFTTVSNYMREFVLNYKSECGVIPNSVDISLFKNDKERIIDGTFKLITVCALREGKCLDIAFKAIKILLDEGFDITYDIVGDGFYENVYREASKEVGVDDRVTFLGRKDKADISKILLDHHALLISSDHESFAIPGIEALASGMPVITTDCEGPKEFIDSSTGRVAKINDPEDLARAIREVMDNYDKFDRDHLEEVADRFSDKSVVEQAKSVYEAVIRS